MRATGIIRRIDDLGRVVIPKEVRRSMRIKEGDPLEIFTMNDGTVCFKKYMPTNEGECVAILKGLFHSVTKQIKGKVAIYGLDDIAIRRSVCTLPSPLSDRADECKELADYKIYSIRGKCDILAFLAVEKEYDSELVKVMVANTEAILRELEY